MATLENLGTVLQADVLIVGGGIAGLACAISAKETDPEVDVLIVDKVVTGWGGKANKGGGNIVFMDEADGFDNVLDFHVHNVGDFLEDQELLLDFAKESRPNLERLERWGVHIYRDDAGEPKYVRWLPEHPWRMAVLDQDLTLNMAKHARKLGVRIRDRVEITDLLKDDDRVCGAIGFGMIDGECVIAQAGAVVLANGNQCYKLMPRWASAGGEGIAAAYRAGAAMRGAEFGNFINWVFADTKEVCQGAEDVLYNAKGENISKTSPAQARVGRPLQGGRGVVEGDEGRQRPHRRQHDRELRQQRDRAGVPRGQARRPARLDEVLGSHDRQGHGRFDGPRTDAAGHARPQRRTRAGQGRPPDGDDRAGPLRHRRHVLRRDLPRRRRAGSPRPHARLGSRLRHVLRRPLRAGGGGRGPGRLRSPGRRAGGGAQGEDLRAAAVAPVWLLRRWSARSRT